METFTQPKVTGYRQLSEKEVSAVNELKQKAEECSALIDKIMHEAVGFYEIDERWSDVGTLQLQQGFMSLTRSIFKPTTF